MRATRAFGTVVGMAALGGALAACGGVHQGTLTKSGHECKASYTEAGQLVTVKVQEHGPAIVKTIVTDAHGNKHGSTVQLSANQSGATVRLTAPPPVKRVQVRISEASGISSCTAG